MADVRVKICGLSTEATLDAALDAGADLVGFVHFPRSPRHVALDRGGRLAGRARGGQSASYCWSIRTIPCSRTPLRRSIPI